MIVLIFAAMFIILEHSSCYAVSNMLVKLAAKTIHRHICELIARRLLDVSAHVEGVTDQHCFRKG